MSKTRCIVLIQLLQLICCSMDAQLSLPKVIGNNMVLQRNQPVPVWGIAKADNEVTVEFSGQVKKAKAGSDGNWKLLLDPMPASSTPGKMVISSAGDTITLKNIL